MKKKKKTQTQIQSEPKWVADFNVMVVTQVTTNASCTESEVPLVPNTLIDNQQTSCKTHYISYNQHSSKTP
jgi:hypothetical protein